MDISVEQCSRERALDILQDSSVCVPWGIYADDILDTTTLYIVNDKILLQLMPDGDEIEVHIACKYRDRIGARPMLADVLVWLKSIGFVKIVTSAPENRKALQRMLLSLGFTKLNERWQYGD
jgi:hypothetical protein